MQSYEPLALLGSGAYADAFLARNLVTGLSYVIKSVRPNPKHPCDLLAEGRILASFNHPHIIRYVVVTHASLTDAFQLPRDH
jgi:serine/threonine protein kinase